MKTSKKLNGHALGVIIMLVVQYLLGMLANLYVQFPENKTELQQWDFARGQLLVMAHIVLGMLILIGVIVLYVRAMRMKDRTWKIASGIALGSVILAVMSGSEFISLQQASYSFAMSVFFLTAVGSIVWGLYKTKA